ncbi:hypothetical protein HS7_00510 [Sulfolobales archaeon HS-7]|nr:hypothetical protein HS7_00510 [Sulfolobales archaeon HS-7]
MARSKKAKKTKESKLLYVPFIVLGVILVLLIGGPYIFPHNAAASSIEFGTFYKVSNQDYAPPGKVYVYFVSWQGCPIGASYSWPLYIALSHFGKLNVTLNYSDPQEAEAPNLPMLLFTGFTSNSSVNFVPIYLYNRYMNATPNGTPITGNLVTYGLEELKGEVPLPIYNIVKNYTTELDINDNGQILQPSAYDGSPPHINTVLVITGPGGTYIINGPATYDNQPAPFLFKGLSDQPLWQYITTGKTNNVPGITLSYINYAASQILGEIQDAM